VIAYAGMSLWIYIKALTLMQIMAITLNNVNVINGNDGIYADNVINVNACGSSTSNPTNIIL
jgi:hypothetical protein